MFRLEADGKSLNQILLMSKEAQKFYNKVKPTRMNPLEKEEAFKSNCTKDFKVDWFLFSPL